MREQSLDLHAMRQRVSARDKALIGSKPVAEGVKLLKEKYGLREDSAAAFVAWQKGVSGGGDGSADSNPTEKWHLKYDESAGQWTKLPQPGDPNYDGPERSSPPSKK